MIGSAIPACVSQETSVIVGNLKNLCHEIDSYYSLWSADYQNLPIDPNAYVATQTDLLHDSTKQALVEAKTNIHKVALW